MREGSDTKDNATVEENRRAGTLEWQLRNVRFDDPVTLASFPLVRHLTSSALQGYASKTSVYPGESIDIMVSMEPEGEFTIDFLSARVVWRTGRQAHGADGTASRQDAACADDVGSAAAGVYMGGERESDDTERMGERVSIWRSYLARKIMVCRAM